MAMTKIEFLTRTKKIHGEKYDYSHINFVDGQTPVAIICFDHGEFYQSPSNHLRGRGCKKCAIKKMTFSLQEFIARAKDKHGNKYDYSLVNYKDSQTKIVLVCPIHGEFSIVPNHHIQGQGCRKCGNIQTANQLSLGRDKFIARAINKHGNKYDYSKVEYINNCTSVLLKCNKHGFFSIKPCNHFKGDGCKKCGIEERANNCRFTKGEFVENAKQIHGEKYDYSKVEYVNARTKIKITCPEHGQFEQCPGEHLSGKGCTQCGIIKRGLKKRSTKEEFLDKAHKIHGDKYDYSNITFIKNSSPIVIQCKEHGNFTQLASSHLNGCGCPKCGGTFQKTKEEFIADAKEVHGNKYDYSHVDYTSNKTRVKIICPKHGAFLQQPSNHISSKMGCPRCKESIGERIIRRYLEKHNILHKQEYRFKKHKFNKRFDFAVLRNNVICLIEYHGLHHYIPHAYGKGRDNNREKIRHLINCVSRDVIKEKWCKSINRELLIIPFWDMHRIDNILDAFFANIQVMTSQPPEKVVKYKHLISKIKEKVNAR